MAVDRQASSVRAPWLSVRRLTVGGTTGNERLTAASGVVLIALLAMIGVTITGALTLGTVLAIVTIPQFAPWLHATDIFHHSH